MQQYNHTRIVVHTYTVHASPRAGTALRGAASVVSLKAYTYTYINILTLYHDMLPYIILTYFI